MMYALIGFIGVLLGAACVYVCTPEQTCSGCCEMQPAPEQPIEDAGIMRQWQNLLNFTADAGGENDDDAES